MIRVTVPCYHKVEGAGGDSYTAYKVQVWNLGRQYCIEKRYSEFEELHKQMRKMVVTPEFPPKRVLKWQHRVLEHRRAALEVYMQGILEGETIPRSFFKFLELGLPRTASFDSLDQTSAEPAVTHQAIVGFTKDAFLQENHRSILPDIVAMGVHDGLYSSQQDDYLYR